MMPPDGRATSYLRRLSRRSSFNSATNKVLQFYKSVIDELGGGPSADNSLGGLHGVVSDC
jgi:hypothetical protein